jgi:hypothetical protein
MEGFGRSPVLAGERPFFSSGAIVRLITKEMSRRGRRLEVGSQTLNGDITQVASVSSNYALSTAEPCHALRLASEKAVDRCP